MERFLIEVPHEAEEKACIRALQVLLATGSHYLTNADFGCEDGVHLGWLIVEVETKEDARAILPPLYRSEAKVVKLTKLKDFGELLEEHG
jgi:hypothetical protein